jgi:hypothetical protein
VIELALAMLIGSNEASSSEQSEPPNIQGIRSPSNKYEMKHPCSCIERPDILGTVVTKPQAHGCHDTAFKEGIP